MTYVRQRGQAAWWLSGVLAIGTGVLGWLFYDSEQQQQQIANELRSANSSVTALERAAVQANNRETELNRQIAQLQLQLSNISQQDQNQSQQLNQLRTELSQAQQQLQNTTRTLESTEQLLQERSAKLQAQEQEIATLKQAVSELEQQVATTEQQLVTQSQQAALALRELDTLRVQLDEAATTEQRYLAAREQLALREAQNETYEQTIARLQRELDAEAAAMEQLERSLQNQLQALNQEKQQLVSKLEDGTTAIQFPESILFASGSAELNVEGKRSLAQLATALNSFPDYLISVQGHSDSRSIAPPTNQKYPTNWELSSARAAAAVRELIAAGINKAQLQAVGYADARPLVPETDAASLQKNRRIEVILIPNAFNTRVLNPEQ